MSMKHGMLLLLAFTLASPAIYAQDSSKPFELNASQTDVVRQQQPYVPEYSKPQMVGAGPGISAPPNPPPKPPKPKKLDASVQHNEPPRRQMIQQQPVPAVQSQQPMQPNVLPPQFLGRWQVLGNFSGVEINQWYQGTASPERVQRAYPANNSQVWTIQGSPEQGYMMSSDTGMSTPLIVESKGNMAIIKYQHQVINTMAQEAIVMQLGPNGAQFDGLQRITVAKPGEPGPRFKVTYKLIGHRQ